MGRFNCKRNDGILDIDTPVTLANLKAGTSEYVNSALIPQFDADICHSPAAPYWTSWSASTAPEWQGHSTVPWMQADTILNECPSNGIWVTWAPIALTGSRSYSRFCSTLQEPLRRTAS